MMQSMYYFAVTVCASEVWYFFRGNGSIYTLNRERQRTHKNIISSENLSHLSKIIVVVILASIKRSGGG